MADGSYIMFYNTKEKRDNEFSLAIWQELKKGDFF
jgi:hypothetical protein